MFIRAWSCMNRVWSGVVRGEPRRCRVQQGMPDRPRSTRCHYGPSRGQHGRYTDRPGLRRINESSRTVTDDPVNFKHFKTSGWCPRPCRTKQDHAGPSRTVPDNPQSDLPGPAPNYKLNRPLTSPPDSPRTAPHNFAFVGCFGLAVTYLRTSKVYPRITARITPDNPG